VRGLTPIEALVLTLLNGVRPHRYATDEEENAAFDLARRGCVALRWVEDGTALSASITAAGVEALRLHNLVIASCGE
jgi:hypothetical protein